MYLLNRDFIGPLYLYDFSWLILFAGIALRMLWDNCEFEYLFCFQCDKIKKRRYSLFGTFHLANSSALEEAGLQITKAV